MKEPDGIRSTTDTGNQTIRQTPFLFEDLNACFASDYTLVVSHHERVGMWTKSAAEQVIGVGDICDPIAQRFVNCVFESSRAGVYFTNFRAEQLHAKNVQLLTTHVFGAHVDHTIESKQRADSRGCDAVLTRARLGDDALLVHATSEQDLANRVVDLMRAGVQEIFAFEVDCRAAAVVGQSCGVEEGRGSAGVVVL